MAVVTGNFHVDYVITIAVTYLVTLTHMGIDLAQKLYIFYPDVTIALAAIVGVIGLIYFIRNIVSIVYGLFITLVRLVIILTIVSIGSWVYFRGFENFQGDFKRVVDFVAHYDQHSLEEVKEYASSVKDHTHTLKQYVNL